MNTRLAGLKIRQERLRRAWSQEGLCRGICAVSYLSKIERGEASASEELVRLLLARLGLDWTAEEAAERDRSLIEQCYDAVFSGDARSAPGYRAALTERADALAAGPYFLDAMLLRAWLTQAPAAAADAFVSAFDKRQQMLWLLLSQRYDEATRLFPCALACHAAGADAYAHGSYSKALEQLQRGYALASDDGRAFLMLNCQMMIVICYSSLREFDRMQTHARMAERLARAVDDGEAQKTIQYNLAATALELGRVQEAYDYFSALETPSALSLHKLAICCEKLGKLEEARAALACVPNAPTAFDAALLDALCAPVRWRLEHPDYLRSPAYGALLLDTFARIRRELPSGYAEFHLPWVLEWYTANRQYKQACELLQIFPAYHA